MTWLPSAKSHHDNATGSPDADPSLELFLNLDHINSVPQSARHLAPSQEQPSISGPPGADPGAQLPQNLRRYDGVPNVWDVLLNGFDQQSPSAHAFDQNQSFTAASSSAVSPPAPNNFPVLNNTTTDDQPGRWRSRMSHRHFRQPNAHDAKPGDEDGFTRAAIASPAAHLHSETSDLSNEGWDTMPEFNIATHSDESRNLIVGALTTESKLNTLKRPSDSESADVWDNRENLSTGVGTGDPKQFKRARRDRTLDELEKVRQVRKESACIRCQVLKESCGPSQPCQHCREVNATATVWRAPCFKGRITDAKVFRDSALSFPNGVRKIDSWIAVPKIKITLYNVGYGQGHNMDPLKRPTITVVCQQFAPLPEDTLCKKYVRGDETIVVQLPAYAIPSRYLTRTTKQLQSTVERNWDMLANELELGQDELIASSLKEALRVHKQFPLVHEAITLCIMTRLLSKSFNLIGKESLGIATVDDAVSPYFGRKPIPPLLDAQIDQLWMHLLTKVKKMLLSDLKRKIMARKKEHWYQIFLTLLILIANLEFVYSVQNDQLRRYCLKKPRSSFPLGAISLMDAWEHGAKNILTHFRVVFNGSAPFAIDAKDQEARKAMNLDMPALEYFQCMREMVSKRMEELSNVRKQTPGTPLIWVADLFLPIVDDDL